MKRPQKVAQVAVCYRTEHHTVLIGCQHQCCLHYCLGQGTGAMLTVLYRLQRVQFVASRCTVFAVLPRKMDRSLVRVLNVYSKVC